VSGTPCDDFRDSRSPDERLTREERRERVLHEREISKRQAARALAATRRRFPSVPAVRRSPAMRRS